MWSLKPCEILIFLNFRHVTHFDQMGHILLGKLCREVWLGSGYVSWRSFSVSIGVSFIIRRYPKNRKYGFLTFILPYLNQSQNTIIVCLLAEILYTCVSTCTIFPLGR